MKAIRLLLCLVILFSFSLYAKKPSVAKIPAWVTNNIIDYTTYQSSKDIENGYIDIEVEKQVNIADQAVYNRRAVKIITEAGVQNKSTISVDYDPTYQQVIFHTILVVRNNKVINKLNLSKMKTVQEETELSRSVYNGTLTSVLFLEDVRKGDIIEYSYTITGFNPVFNNKYSASLGTQYSVPVSLMYYKIICPAFRKLNIKNSNTDIQPLITNVGGNKVYEWKMENIKALKPEDELPTWYDPYPEIMVSEYDSWKDVNAWALTLFKMKEPLSTGLKNKIEEIKSKYKTPEEQVSAALRFVQDEVRYLGIEIGENTHRPNSPNKIFAQRFGDCKDKSFLLCIMLQSFGIEASPVLINASSQHAIINWQPSPFAFNHCTVRAVVNNKTYWFDPTIAFQRGSLRDISFPDYKCGLVLIDTTTELTSIPLQDSGMVIAKEIFTVTDISGPARLKVITTYTGSFADEFRDGFSNGSMEQIQKDYLDFYNHFYEGVKVSDTLKIDEDPASGKITTYEYYTVRKLWELEKGVSKASFYGVLINSILKKPEDHERKMPFSIKYPASYTEEIVVNLPETWSFKKTPEAIQTPGFVYTSSMNHTESSINLKYEYKALQDYIDAKDASDFLTKYEKLKDDMAYELTKGPEKSAETHISTPERSKGNMLGMTILLIIISGVIIKLPRPR